MATIAEDHLRHAQQRRRWIEDGGQRQQQAGMDRVERIADAGVEKRRAAAEQLLHVDAVPRLVAIQPRPSSKRDGAGEDADDDRGSPDRRARRPLLSPLHAGCPSSRSRWPTRTQERGDDCDCDERVQQSRPSASPVAAWR